MNRHHVAIGLLATAITLVAPAAHAQPEALLAVAPERGAPGTAVTIQVTCAQPVASPPVSSALRMTTPLGSNPEGHQPWALFVKAVVADVRPGSYPVHFDCGSVRVDATFTVLARPQVPQKPKGAPETGDGSTSW